MAEQALNLTSSIGAVWPPVISTNDRIKGFCDEAVITPEDAENFATEFVHSQQDACQDASISRVSIRTIASLEAVRSLDELGVPLEAAMPIKGSNDRIIVYAGWNAPERTISEDWLQRHHKVLNQIVTASLTPQHRFIDMRPQVIDRRTSEAVKEKMIDRFVGLYAFFGYDEQDVEDLLFNPANTIAYIEDDEGIVSTAMAERATLNIKGHGQTEVAEITEAITRPSERGKGFYRAISGYLGNQLLNDRDPLDVIYGESNLAVSGVLIAAHQNGRRFSYFDRERLAVNQPAFGIIQQNFKVEDGQEDRSYNDFALSYFPLD
ncbi:MAG TPA: hypothetical protein VHC21_04040 [Candidatus Saccharimonadales bacterium]|nr:hypothetical protein [Candidatus Saccharimonadales bacterium]